jgi:uncharacterized repeat protein (TIGR01451 family)
MACGRRHAGLVLLLCLAAVAGCFGGTHNPDAYPHLFPFGDVVRTHAKPPGYSYFTNFDPHAVRLDVVPLESTSPARSSIVLLATVLDEKGQPRRNRRVEWMLEGAGNIIEVDESGFLPGRGYKVDNRYAVSYTDYLEHKIHRRSGTPAEDFTVGPGQSWCVISSAVEGDTHVTVYAPEIADWDRNRVVVSQHWVDAEWVLPPPAAGRAGAEQALATTVFRHTDHQPLANYQVRYRVLDGPPASLLPGQGAEAVVATNLSGHASVALVQAHAQPGRNRVGIEVLRGPDPSTPSGSAIVIGRGETTVDWQTPEVSLAPSAPPSVTVGQEVAYTLTVQNTGPVEAHALTLRTFVPEEWRYLRSEPPAIQEDNQLLWTFSDLAARDSRRVQVTFLSGKPGLVDNRVSLVTGEGLHDEKAVTTRVLPPAVPGLKLALTGPASAVLLAGNGNPALPIAYQLTVSNPGTGPANNVLLQARFDDALEHDSRANPVELPLGTLAAGASRTVSLTLRPRRPGPASCRVVATADGGLVDQAQHTLTVQSARLEVRLTGRGSTFVGRPAVWDVEVANAGEVALADVALTGLLPAELEFAGATEGGQLRDRQVVWGLGSMKPGEQRRLQLTTTATRLAEQVRQVAVAAARVGDSSGAAIQAQSEASLSIQGLPAFKLSVVDGPDPVEVGGTTTYKIDVINQGSLPGTQVQLTAILPSQMRLLGARGATQNRVDGQRVVFAPLESLAPGQTVTYTLQAEAVEGGDARFRAELTSSTLRLPLVKEESTNVLPLNRN